VGARFPLYESSNCSFSAWKAEQPGRGAPVFSFVHCKERWGSDGGHGQLTWRVRHRNGSIHGREPCLNLLP